MSYPSKMLAFVTEPELWQIPQIAHPSSTAERWASYVLRACKSEKDLKTLGMWARQVGVSYTTLCETCRLIGAQPRHARDFVRILRIVTRPSLDLGQFGSVLDISDRRTLETIMENGGFRGCGNLSRPVSVAIFFDNQRFISCENAGLKVIRAAFTASGWQGLSEPGVS